MQILSSCKQKLRLSSLKGQRGAFGIQAAITLFWAVLFAVLAIDSGRLMLEQKRLQTVADMAALDAASATGSCGIGDKETVDAVAEASAGRNDHDADQLNVYVGNINVVDGIRTFYEDLPDQALAAKVEAFNTIPASLVAGGWFGEDITLQASAVAERQAVAGFTAGSGLLGVSSEASILNALLGDVLGSAVNLDLVSYQGIVATDVTLLNLVEAAAGVGTVDELLNANLSLGDVLQLYADAVAASDTATVEVISAMETLATVNVSNLSVVVGDILAVTTPTADAAATVGVNLLDLLTTTILVANGQNAIALPLNVNLLGLNIGTYLTVIEPPQIAIGPPGKDAQGEWITQTHSAQIRLDTRVTGSLGGALLSLVANVSVDLAISVEVANGDAWLDSIQCYNAANPLSTVTIGARPGVASVALTGSNPDDPATISVKALLNLLTLANIEAGLNVPLASSSAENLQYRVARNHESSNLETDPCLDDLLPCTQRASAGLGSSLDNGLTTLFDELELQVELAGLSLAIVDELLEVLVGPLVGQLTSALPALLDPLLRLLGIQIGFLDVQLFTLDISRPKLLI